MTTVLCSGALRAPKTAVGDRRYNRTLYSLCLSNYIGVVILSKDVAFDTVESMSHFVASGAGIAVEGGFEGHDHPGSTEPARIGVIGDKSLLKDSNCEN